MSSSKAMVAGPAAAAAEPAVYVGGNEVFFSFMQTLQEGIDQGILDVAAYEALVRRWGEVLGARARLPRSLGPALNRISDMLSTLGLVRVFEPSDVKNGEGQVMVLRCLAGRYLDAPRARQRKPRGPCLVRLLVEGALKAAGVDRAVAESRRGMLRADECMLTISAPAPAGGGNGR
jgi:hypothetical protein